MLLILRFLFATFSPQLSHEEAGTLKYLSEISFRNGDGVVTVGSSNSAPTPRSHVTVM